VKSEQIEYRQRQHRQEFPSYCKDFAWTGHGEGPVGKREENLVFPAVVSPSSGKCGESPSCALIVDDVLVDAGVRTYHTDFPCSSQVDCRLPCSSPISASTLLGSHVGDFLAPEDELA
jgi:hypothetical protein